MKDEPLHRHKEAAPTVIHDYGEDETVLERWFRQGLEKGASFWLLVAGVVALAVIVMVLTNVWSNRRSPATRAWTELMVPSTVPETASEDAKGLPAPARPLMELAETFPETEAAHWALYQSACYLYQEGLRDLPNNRDAAKPILNQSIELFDRVIKEAEKASPLRRLAMMGKARALESRGELSEAREQYQEVAADWPDSEVASQAKERAAKLDTPEVKKFYEDFYAQDFSRFTSGSGLGGEAGTGLELPPGHPSFGSPTDLGLPRALPPDLGTEPIAPTPSDAPEPAPSTGSGLPELPPGLFAPDSTPGPSPESATPAAPEPAPSTGSGLPELPPGLFAPDSAPSPSPEPAATETEPAPKVEPGELPNDPFAPGGSTDSVNP